MRALYNNATDTSTNESKEQISLDQGSSEYEKFIETREANMPSVPDDEMHVKLEQRNADLTQRNLRLAELAEEKDRDPAAKKQARLESRKRAVKMNAHAAAVREAFRTETTEDDDRLDDKTLDDMVYDPAIQADKIDDRFVDYVVTGKY